MSSAFNSSRISAHSDVNLSRSCFAIRCSTKALLATVSSGEDHRRESPSLEVALAVWRSAIAAMISSRASICNSIIIQPDTTLIPGLPIDRQTFRNSTWCRVQARLLETFSLPKFLNFRTNTPAIARIPRTGSCDLRDLKGCMSVGRTLQPQTLVLGFLGRALKFSTVWFGSFNASCVTFRSR